MKPPLPKPSSAPEFSLGDIVRKKVNKEVAGMVTGLIYRPSSIVQYLVTWGDAVEEQVHFEIELMNDDDVIEKSN